jgi:hypothetical protein
VKKERKSKTISVLFSDEKILNTTLSAKKTDELFKSWLEVYGNGSPEKSCLLDKFNNERFPPLCDIEAKENYEKLDQSDGYFLILDHNGTSAYQLEKGPLPSWELLVEINSLGKDVCVAGLDLSWTLFFRYKGRIRFKGRTGIFVKRDS